MNTKGIQLVGSFNHYIFDIKGIAVFKIRVTSAANYTIGDIPVLLYYNDEDEMIGYSSSFVSPYYIEGGTEIDFEVPDGATKVITNVACKFIAYKLDSEFRLKGETNVLDIADYTFDKQFINTASMSKGSAGYDDWKCVLIPVKPNTTYTIKTNNYEATKSQFFAVYLYNNATGSGSGAIKAYATANHPTNSGKEIELWGKPDVNGGFQFTTTEDTKTIGFNLQLISSYKYDISDAVVYEGLEENTVLSINGVDLMKLISNKIDYLASLASKAPAALLSSFNYAVFGDSITNLGGDNCTGEQGWTTHFKTKVVPRSIKSYARSGARWVSDPTTIENTEEKTSSISPSNVAYNQYARLRNDIESNVVEKPDIVFIALGTNDAWYPGSSPNAMDDDPKDIFTNNDKGWCGYAPNELTTIVKAMKQIVELLYDLLPEVQIIILTPPPAKFDYTRIKDCGDLIEETCYYLGVSCIRLDKESGFYMLREKSNPYNTYDGIHTSAIGAKELGNFIANKTASLLWKA